MKEIWKNIYDYDYKISSFGRVKNKNGKLLKSYDNGSGYLKIRLYKKGYKTFYIHRMVAEHFIYNIENKKCVNHKDGNKKNNTVKNLEWCTYSENHEHAYKNNLKKPHSKSINRGASRVTSKLTNLDVLQIRKLHGKISATEISKIFNISYNHTIKVIHRYTWNWLNEDGTETDVYDLSKKVIKK